MILEYPTFNCQSHNFRWLPKISIYGPFIRTFKDDGFGNQWYTWNSKVLKIMAQYPNTELSGSIGDSTLGILEVQGVSPDFEPIIPIHGLLIKTHKNDGIWNSQWYSIS